MGLTLWRGACFSSTIVLCCFCAKTDEFCTKTDELCTKNDELCTKKKMDITQLTGGTSGWNEFPPGGTGLLIEDLIVRYR